MRRSNDISRVWRFPISRRFRCVRSKRPRLLAVKPGRTRAEYCWTMTPFACQAVFDRDPSSARATYVDADVFFFDDPRVLLRRTRRVGQARAHHRARVCARIRPFAR